MSELKISVSYYDKSHKKLFETYNNYANIETLVNNTVSINKEEFLTYLMYTEQRNSSGFQTYKDLNAKKSRIISFLDDYITFPRNTLKSNFVGKDMYKDLTERIGVSVSLCLMNKLHNLTEADWEFIPEQAGRNGYPTLDYKISSTGKQYIQVESKGSTDSDNRKKPAKVSNHKRSIEKKKKKLRSLEASKANNSKSLAYGVITVLDNREDTIAKSWLLDPPAFSLNISPKKYKLLSRLYFYWKNLLGISSRTLLLSSLINRIKVIETISNYEELNNLSLFNSQGKKIEVSQNSFGTKTIVLSNLQNGIGRIYQCYLENKLFFIGFQEDVFQVLISQNFNQILSLKYENSTRTERLLCRVSRKDIERMNLLRYNNINLRRRNDDYFEFFATGIMTYSQSGRIFGFIDLNEVNGN